MYSYVYFRLYKLAKITERQWAEGARMPEWIALFLLFLLVIFNLFSLLIFLRRFLELSIPSLNKWIAVVVFIFFMIINYFVFIRNDRFVRIEKKYDSISNKEKAIRSILFWIYLVITIGAMVGILTLLDPK